MGILAKRQPQGLARVQPQYQKNLIFAYLPPYSTTRNLSGTALSTTGYVPAKKVTTKGVSAAFDGTAGVTVSNTTAAPASGSLTILIVFKRSTASGIQNGIARAGATANVGGFGIALYNQFGTPPNQLFCSYRGAGSEQLFEAVFLDGADVTANSNGGTLTNTDQYYTVIARADAIGAAAIEVQLGILGSSLLIGDIAFAAVWDAKFSNAVMQKLSANPWQTFDAPGAKQQFPGVAVANPASLAWLEQNDTTVISATVGSSSPVTTVTVSPGTATGSTQFTATVT